MDSMCFDFVNSQWYITHDSYTDPLKDSNWFKAFLEKWNAGIDIMPSDQQFEQLLALRTLLSGIIFEISTLGRIKEENIKEINNYLALTPFNLELRKENTIYSVSPEPLQKDWNYILNKIVFSLTEIISKHGISRIRMCENPECRWVFFDESKNHTRKWCGNTCSSLIKVRRFREKLKE